ncbi:MAG: radical SAM family heme chaperone HemW [Anaerolineae bacterium]
MPHAIYIHIPFCHHRCSYCDFNIYAGQQALFEPYIQAVAEEIAATASRVWRVPVPSIYLGGGTPSLLPVELIGGLLATVHAFFEVDNNAEITVEVNPLTKGGGQQAGGERPSISQRLRSMEYFVQLRSLGVNRLSLGVQSSHDDELHLLRRGHSFQDTVDTYRAMRDAGFDNINLDLIYGLPDQSLDAWRTTLQRVIDLQPDHISAYSLQVEEHTALFNWVRDGKVPAPDEERVAEMYELTQAMLAEAGFEHYEISNWASRKQEARGTKQADYRSRHNLVYWRNEAYFGFGCGAHSFHDGRRYSNVLLPHDYIRSINTVGDAVADSEDDRSGVGGWRNDDVGPAPDRRGRESDAFL